MKNLKKFFGIFAVMVMLFAITGLCAHARAYYDYVDFSNENMGIFGATLKTETGGFGNYKTENAASGKNDYYNLGVQCVSLTQSESDTHLQYTAYRDFSIETKVSFKVRITNDKNGSMSFSLRHSGSNEHSYGTLGLISFSGENCQASYLGEFQTNAKETLERGKWYTFEIRFNLAEDVISVYRDGELKASSNSVRTYNAKLKQFIYEKAQPRFQTFVSKSKVGNKISFDIDDFELVGNESVNSNFFVTAKTLKTFVNGSYRNADYIRNGKFLASAKAENVSTQSLSCVMAAARYSASGNMIKMYKGEPVNILPNQSAEVSVEFSIDNVADGEYLRTFLIDNFENISPLASYDEYEKSLLNPFGSDVLTAVKKQNPDKSHPRLMLTKDKLSYLAKACYETEPYMSWYKKIKNGADNLINKDFAVYDDLDELRLSGIYTSSSNITSLAFVYAIENAAGKPAEKYAKRIVDEMVNISVDNPEWADWNPKHFLDTSSALVAYGLAYDWCYDYFNRSENAGEKEMFFDTLKTYGLDPSNLAYDQISNYWWTNTNNNWNMVCNGGVAVASLAVCDEEGFEDISAKLLESGLKSVRKCFADFAPDGAWFEGTGYWQYTVNLMSIYFDSLKTAAGSDFDYMKLPGVSKTGLFPIAMIGRSGNFNLNDASAGNINIPELWYFANTFNNPTMAKYRYYQISKQGFGTSYKDILWYNEELLGDDKDNVQHLLEGMQTDVKYSGVEIAIFRDGFFENGNYYVGFHGGKNGINHGHIDAGSFIYDAKSDGAEYRWAIDLGGDNYNLYNMFGGNATTEKSRWAYYRNRGEGHNTIIINPGLLADQPIDKTAKISEYKSASEYGYAVVNMQPIYGKYTQSAQRGVYFNKINGSLLVRDEIVFNDGESNNLYWFMHTKANIELSEDKKSAILTNGSGSRLWVGIIDSDQTFSVSDAVPLETSPNPNEWEENKANDGSSTNPQKQNENTGVRKLVINDKNASGNWNTAVYMVLLKDGQTAPDSLPENIDISLWN